MKTFKDFVANDVANVFINCNEFAEKATINSVEIDVVIETDFTKLQSTNFNLVNCDVVFHTAMSNFARKPSTDGKINFNGTIYRVEDVSEESGMLTIGLSRRTS